MSSREPAPCKIADLNPQETRGLPTGAPAIEGPFEEGDVAMTTGVYLFDLASQHARYLAVRQATIAGNVANANTAGFKARDVVPFAQVLARTGLDMRSTADAHLEQQGNRIPVREQAGSAWEVLTSSSEVSLEQEMLKGGEVARQSNLDNAVVKSFHRMLMSAVRSGS
ncbi:flagellar basal-body rod protein FlgB [Methylorubrum salsuginis]|uniref:Flagellar basal-body rod protein FlgB n=2 Tax=Methylorubrum salsuginis TaxID=414703 RepID=A0A1I4GYQ7_9HYPH|nr:flagellar basal-body rod protein FlgB [Methylorubrum salsuginis]